MKPICPNGKHIIQSIVNSCISLSITPNISNTKEYKELVDIDEYELAVDNIDLNIAEGFFPILYCNSHMDLYM